MSDEVLVHKTMFQVGDDDYEVLVYTRKDGTHAAKTFFSSNDVIVNDGPSLEATLEKHQRVLPLAVNSRAILKDYQSTRH